MPNVERFCAAGVYDPPTYTQGIRVTGAQTLLFLSGQVAYTADGGVAHPGDVVAQARGAFDAIRALLESQGASMADIVKLTTYVTDMGCRAALAPIRAEYLGPKAPTSTLVEVSALAHPDWLIEIEAIAVV